MKASNYKKFIKRNKFFNKIYNDIRVFDHHFDRILKRYHKYAEIISKMVYSWDEEYRKSLPNKIIDICIDLNLLNKEINKVKSAIPRRVIEGKEKYISIYFSF